ncbi:MAG: hypothetical protein AMXMBFR64_56580 [Myxococcales bacterium]
MSRPNPSQPVALAGVLEATAAHSATVLSQKARGLAKSEILTIAYDIRDRVARGERITNLTVGDFSPREFPIPRRLIDGIVAALEGGHTNYPPSSGTVELRDALRVFYARRLGLDYPAESVLIGGGARPMIMAAYQALVEPGDVVVYGVPSWNNEHYAYLTDAEAIELRGDPAEGFMPDVDAYRPHLRRARLLFFNTPLNPTGTMLQPDKLARICEAVIEENARRAAAGERALFIVFDQVYWMITFGGEHASPPQIDPRMAPYTILIDAVSKSFAATGLRVGWAFGPAEVITRMGAFVSHMGAWAPRPEQIAFASLLRDDAAVNAFHAAFVPALGARLRVLYDGLMALKAGGFPVDAIAPEGALYLSAKIDLIGRTTPEGVTLGDIEAVRTWLLGEAGMGVVPFRAFGYANDTEGWMRLSVGAVSIADCHGVVERLGRALAALR